MWRNELFNQVTFLRIRFPLNENNIGFFWAWTIACASTADVWKKMIESWSYGRIRLRKQWNNVAIRIYSKYWIIIFLFLWSKSGPKGNNKNLQNEKRFKPPNTIIIIIYQSICRQLSHAWRNSFAPKLVWPTGSKNALSSFGYRIYEWF